MRGNGALFGFVPSAAVAAAPLLPGSSLRQHDGRTSHSRKGNGTRKERRARRVAHSCCFSSICPPFSALPWLLLSAPAPCQLKDCESVPVGGPALVVCDRAHNWAKRVRRISCISSHTRTCEQLAACSSRQTDRQTDRQERTGRAVGRRTAKQNLGLRDAQHGQLGWPTPRARQTEMEGEGVDAMRQTAVHTNVASVWGECIGVSAPVACSAGLAHPELS